jgi:hypothetical protein
MRRHLPIDQREQIGRLPKPDLWTSLRYAYTGPNFFISLLFLVAFAMPYVAKGVLLADIARGERVLAASVGPTTRDGSDDVVASPRESAKLRALHDEIVALENEIAAKVEPAMRPPQPSSGSAEIGAVDAGSGDTRTDLMARVARLKREIETLASTEVHRRAYPIWKILLGIDTGDVGWTLLISLLVVYNALKWFLTTNVAPMRDIEERSHVTPARFEYVAFAPAHHAVTWLFWLSVGSGAFTFFQWMTTPVYKFW